MQESVDMFAAPGDALERLVNDPKARTPLAICVGVFSLLAWLNGCWQNFTEAFSWSNLFGPALISPLIVGIVSLGTTAVIYLLNLILGDREARSKSFKTLYSVNIHCAMIFLLGEVVNFLLVRANILGDHPPPLRGRFPVGLDILLLGVDDPNLYLSIILHSTSVFLIWYLVVLSLGISVVTGASKAKAAAIATTLWCILVLFALGMVCAAGGGTTIRIRL
jgi:hypothetical protein